MKITITKRIIDEALKKNRVWDLGNKVLYDLCHKHPLHQKHDEIIAKVWLIGRSYAAAIERRKNKNSDSQGDKFYEKIVGPKIRNKGIDKWFAWLKKQPTPTNAIKTHFKLMGLFAEISDHKNRSLASKYLHFHQPNSFFIFDSRSMAGIRKVTTREEKQLLNLPPREFDKDYANFYQRCLWLQKDLEKKFRRKLSPRKLDKILLYIADLKKK